MLKSQNASLQLEHVNTEIVRIAIIKTSYYPEYNDMLVKYAQQTLVEAGVKDDNIHILEAPGAWEIPYVTQAAIKTKKYDAIITFGVIIKGDTLHFEMIANECGRSLMQLSTEHNIPIALEILAVFNREQAEERAGDNDKNKGIEGAAAVLKALDVVTKIRKTS